MTLSTDIYVVNKIEPVSVFDKMRELIKAPANYQWEDRDSYFDDGDGVRLLAGKPNQGLCAWLMVHYKKDAPLVGQGDVGKHTGYCDDDCKKTDHSDQWYKPHWLKINVDTAYGYRGPMDETCSILHAGFIVDMDAWLAEQGNTLFWHNEYSGTFHDGIDGLQKFIGNGDSANAWFQGIVKPAITSQHGRDNVTFYG